MGLNDLDKFESKGIVEDMSGLSEEYGGKPYAVKIKLENGDDAFIVGGGIYIDIDSQLRSPYTRAVQDALFIGSKIFVHFVKWNGKNIVIDVLSCQRWEERFLK